MTPHPMFRRSVVFASLFAIQFVYGQGSSSWKENFLQGSEAIQLGRYADARRLLLAALDASNQFDANDLRRARTENGLAHLYALQGELKLAGTLYEESLAILQANGEAGKSLLPFVLDGLGELRIEEAHWTEAEQLLQQSKALQTELHGESSPLTMTVVTHLGELYACTGRHPEAENLFRQAIIVFRKSEQFGGLASTLATLGRVYIVEGRYVLAETVLKEALALNTRLGDRHPALADAMLNLAALYRVESNAERAEPLLRKAAKIYADTGDPRLAAALSEIGLIALRHGKYAIAETNLNQALEILTKAFGPKHVSVGLVEAALAEVYLKEHDYSKAELFIRGALEKQRRSLGEASFEVAQSFLIAAQIEEKQNRRTEADTDFRMAVALYGRVIGNDHPETLHARELYSRFSKKASR